MRRQPWAVATSALALGLAAAVLAQAPAGSDEELAMNLPYSRIEGLAV